MKIFLFRKSAVLIIGLGCLPLSAQANTIEVSNAYRKATLGDATAGASGEGNSSAAAINAEFAPGPWTKLGGISADGNDGSFLTIVLTGGAWGSGAASGTWELDSSFWSLYGEAVISMHVGNGNVPAPDHYSFLIEEGATSGTWSYQKLSGNGGGFSNLLLYGSGTPTTHRVPDGGTTLVLAGFAMSALGLLRRKSKA